MCSTNLQYFGSVSFAEEFLVSFEQVPVPMHVQQILRFATLQHLMMNCRLVDLAVNT